MNSKPRRTGRPRRSANDAIAASRLIARRKQLGLSSSQVADRIGISSNRYRYWEKNYSTTIHETYGIILGKVLDVPPSWIINGRSNQDLPIIDQPVISNIPEDVRLILGRRAMSRRLTLKLSRQVVAKAIGVSSVSLGNWERAIPAYWRPIESEWERMLCVPLGWVRNIAILTPPPITQPTRFLFSKAA